MEEEEQEGLIAYDVQPVDTGAAAVPACEAKHDEPTPANQCVTIQLPSGPMQPIYLCHKHAVDLIAKTSVYIQK